MNRVSAVRQAVLRRYRPCVRSADDGLNVVMRPFFEKRRQNKAQCSDFFRKLRREKRASAEAKAKHEAAAAELKKQRLALAAEAENMAKQKEDMDATRSFSDEMLGQGMANAGGGEAKERAARVDLLDRVLNCFHHCRRNTETIGQSSAGDTTNSIPAKTVSRVRRPGVSSETK